MDHPTSADSRLSNYRLERLLGSGGMGEVYLARDLALDRPVAIKFIAPDKVGDASARRRLIREARAAASLDHPNICGVHEVIDTPDGRACIVMQYIEGRTLADVLREGPTDVRLALTIAADLVSALAVAHKHGVIHRDLKPRNIIITPDHRAKLLDFGVARHASSPAGADDGTTTTQLTTPGVIVGTPAYMSPEQVLERPLDGRSDLFALGAVLFECLTGRRPFDGRGGLEQVSEVLHHDPPPVSSLRSGLTTQHDELVRRLLAKAPEDRFGSAEEALGALRVLLPDEPSSRWREPPVGRPSWLDILRRRRAVYVAAAIIVIGAAAGVWTWNRPRPTFEATPRARDLYVLGTEWIRRGAYDSARKALTEAVTLSPGYVPAYVRLAEAASELDDHVAARDALLSVNQFVADADLPPDDRLRAQAVRAIVWRKWNDAIAAYTALAERHPDDAGVLLDVGRVQEAAAMIVQARETYERVIKQRPDYAAAHLRLAGALAAQNDDGALRSFTKAQQLFEAESNPEGQTEAMLQRGAFLNARGRLLDARQALERAHTLAVTLKNREQDIRARLGLSSVTASEGHFRKAQAMAVEAARQAEEADLDTVAAHGLIDLANAILYRQHSDANEVERRAAVENHLQRSIDLADRREARLTRARAQLQLASAKWNWEDHQGALSLAEAQLPLLREAGHVRYELTALTIMSRSLEFLGDYQRARELAEQVLTIATKIGNHAQRAEALDNLAGQSVAMGMLPAAEHFWSESAAARRVQNDTASLPYDLANRAEMLIRLGQRQRAESLLQEIEGQADKRVEAYVGRMRRVRALRALAYATQNRSREAAALAGRVVKESTGITDPSSRLAERLLDHAEAVMGTKRLSPERPWMTAAEAQATDPDLVFWEAAARHASGDFAGVLKQAAAALTWKPVQTSPELEWRIAALGAAAARALKEEAQARTLGEHARRRLQQLHESWPKVFAEYLGRPDLQGLLRKAGIEWRL